jgi:hypothetical protein
VKHKTKENINALDNIAMAAFTDRNFEVFEIAITALAELAFDIEKKHKRLEGDRLNLHSLIFNRLFDAYAEVVDNTRAPWVILNHLEEIGVDAAKEDLDSTWVNVSSYVTAMEKLTIEETSTPISTHKKNLSSYCGQILHKLAISLPTKTKVTSREIGIIAAVIKIHKRHLDNNWERWTIIRLRDAIELLIYYKRWVETDIITKLKGLFDTIPKHVFDYLEYFVNNGVPKDIHYFSSELNQLLTEIEKTNYYGLPSYLIQELGKYGKLCIDKEKPKKDVKEWWREGMGLYLTVAKLGSSVLKHDYFDITLSTIETYMPIIYLTDQYRSNFTAALGLPQLLTEQTQTLEKKGKLDNQEFVRDIIRALEYGLRIYIEFHLDPLANVIAQKSNKENIVQILWEKISPLTYDLLKQGLEKQWGEVVWQVYFFFRDISTENALKKRPIYQEKLMVGVWVSLAAVLSIQEKTKREPPIHDIALSLHAQYLDEEFYKAYQKTSVLVKKLDIQEELGKARSLVNRKRRELGFPTYP